jgi:hypothetical protein
MQVRQALLNTADHINDGTLQTTVYPNNYYGYGFVNVLEAALSDGIIFSNRPLINTNDTVYVVSIKMKSKIALTADSLFLFYKKASAGSFERIILTATGTADEYAARVLKTDIDSTSIGYFSARDNSGTTRTNPYNAPQETFSLKLTNGTVDVASPVSRFLPKEFRLSNYPNPFNPSTTLLIKIPHTEEAEIAIFNILGQQMKIIFKGVLHAGEQRFQWDGTDEHSMPAAASMYIARLKTNSHILSTKLILLK